MKHQATSTKLQRSSKFQASNPASVSASASSSFSTGGRMSKRQRQTRILNFDAWIFSGSWSLGFGALSPL